MPSPLQFTMLEGTLNWQISIPMEDNRPTIRISETGKVTVLNAKGILLLDAEGKEIPTRNRFSLCNCGKTGDAPFCDGSHNG